MSEQAGHPDHDAAGHDAATYDMAAAQDKWRKVWEDLDPFRAGSAAPGAEKRYALTMFPYPSGDLHMGHAEVMALHDVIARYWWQLGYDVLNPIGWDSFGLPAENAAIKRDEHPATYTYANIETQAESFRRYAISFDWTRRLFKVTDYADRLLDDMESLRGSWLERVLTMQKNWIGRSQGAHVTFDVG